MFQIQHFRWTIFDKRLGIKLSGTTLPWNIYTGLTRWRNTDLPKSGLHPDIKAHRHIQKHRHILHLWGTETVSYHFPRRSDYSTCVQQSDSPPLAFRCLSENLTSYDEKSRLFLLVAFVPVVFFPREKKRIWCTISFQPSLLVIIRNPLQRILRRHRSSRREGGEQAVALVNARLEPWPFK